MAFFTPINTGLIILIVGVIVYLIISMRGNRQKKYFFTVRLLTGSKQVFLKSIAKEIKDEKGVSKLLIKKLKEIIPMPPPDAITIDLRGNQYVEAYRDRYGNYAYVCDTGVERFRHPIDTNQQILLADQVIKAHSKKTDWKQFLPMYVGLGFVTVIFIGALLFMGEPIKEFNSYMASQQQKIIDQKVADKDLIHEINNLKTDVQEIRAAENLPTNITIPN